MGQGGAGVCSLRVLLPMQLPEREGRGAVHICAKQIWRKQMFPKVKCDTQDTRVHSLGESCLVLYVMPMLN